MAAGLALLFGVSMTPLMADSSDFAGAYVGIQGQVVGVDGGLGSMLPKMSR